MDDKWWFDHFIFEEYRTSPSSLAIYRLLYSACILTIYLPQHLWITTFPSSFFNPPFGFTIFFAGFPPRIFFIVLNILSISAACCLLFGYRTRLASISLGLLLLTGNAWSYSFGKINNDIFLVLVPLILGFSGWGDAYSVDAGRRRPVHSSYNAWPVALLALSIGLGMMTAAYGKASTGWFDPNTHAVLGHFLANTFARGRTAFMTGMMLQVRSSVFWELLDYATVLLEASFLLAVGNRRAFRIVCALGCFFHMGIALTMRIPFWPNVLAYAAFYDWSSLERRQPAKAALSFWTPSANRLISLKLAVSAVVVSVLYLTFGNPLQRLAALVGPEPEATVAYPPVVIGTMVAATFLAGEVRKAFGREDVAIGPVILFDGFCGLCSKWVDFVLKRDHRSLYRFAALQSPAGQHLLEQAKAPRDFMHSLVLVEGERVFFSSSAVLRILRSLGAPYSLAYVFILVPPQIRDLVYAFVADRRLRWFGKRDVCRLPTPEERRRFL